MNRLLIVVFAITLLLCAGCDYIDIPFDTNEAPDAYIDEVAPQQVMPGEIVSFAGHGTDVDGSVVGYRWRSDIDGELSTKDRFESTTLSEGEHDIYFKVQDNNGTWSSEVGEKVIVGNGSSTEGLPVVNTFSVSPATVAPGGTITLTWDVSSADTVSIDNNVGNVAGTGNTTVSPHSTTTYILTASNAKGTVTASTTVTVASTVPPGYPIVNSFVATPNVIVIGESSVLSWEVTGANNVTITPGIGAVAASGSSVISPVTTTNYTLNASNDVGQFSMTISVVVSGSIDDTTPPEAPILLTPYDGDVLPQLSSPWSFDWDDTVDEESGIDQYQIYVIRLGAANPVIDQLVAESAYTTTLGGVVNSGYLDNWTWKVRAQNGQGLWSDWSEVYTFSVEPNLVTVTLNPVAAETGNITRNSTTSTAVTVGDNATNKPMRGFYSFDILSLAGKEITDASISFAADTVLGDPWQDLEGLGISQIHYTGPLQVSYYTLSGSSVTGSFLSGPPSMVDVTAKMETSTGNADSRFQLLLYFKEETDEDNSGDYIIFSNATLSITYVQ